MNKFLHPPMQALKQAAREGNTARLDALCEAWQIEPNADAEQPAAESAREAGEEVRR